jgi:NAD(P)-dependent dehydrogenase (short-subunit alcohol dehydrogenase family)
MGKTGVFDLGGRVAAVIGGTGVLGGALCHGLGEAGAAIAVLGRSEERAASRVAALEAAGIRAMAVRVDATDPAQVDAACREIEATLGATDILVNAPGVNSATPFLDITLDEWHRLLDANLTSVLVACQVFARSMIAAGRGGSIINMSSASSGPPLSRVLTYSVAKAGLNNLTQYLARELSPHGIRVNAIAPGFFASEMTEQYPDGYLESQEGRIPVGRKGDPAELAATVVFLASDAAGYVTGQTVPVDGGMTIT